MRPTTGSRSHSGPPRVQSARSRILLLHSRASLRCTPMLISQRRWFATTAPPPPPPTSLKGGTPSSISHQSPPSRETIFALASAHGRAGVAVLRLSGPRASLGLSALLWDQPLPPPRVASLRKLHNPRTGELVDRGIVLRFEEGKSFTGEEVVELHVHGGRAVVAEILTMLGEMDEFRSAEPGEFTKRAFLNGRLDLTEVEGLADLVAAETQSQRRQALRQFGGELHRLYDAWREQLVGCMAHVEAVIDFAGEDEQIVEEVARKVTPRVKALRDEITSHLGDARRGERLRDGASIAIVGPPNAGKSSLINFLAQRQVAIVSPIPGTTRDVLEATLDIGGYPVLLADTAGLRKSEDSLEEEGVRRALIRSRSADLRICLFDSSTPLAPPDLVALDLVDDDTVIALNKSDLSDVKRNDLMREISARLRKESPVPLSFSIKTGEGLPAFVRALEGRLKSFFHSPEARPAPTRPRHREHLSRCVTHLDGYLADPDRLECAAEELRQAAKSIGRITGRVDMEEVLDRVFAEFCIGK